MMCYYLNVHFQGQRVNTTGMTIFKALSEDLCRTDNWVEVIELSEGLCPCVGIVVVERLCWGGSGPFINKLLVFVTVVNDQLDAHFFYSIIRLLQSCTCFE